MRLTISALNLHRKGELNVNPTSAKPLGTRRWKHSQAPVFFLKKACASLLWHALWYQVHYNVSAKPCFSADTCSNESLKAPIGQCCFFNVKVTVTTGQIACEGSFTHLVVHWVRPHPPPFFNVWIKKKKNLWCGLFESKLLCLTQRRLWM